MTLDEWAALDEDAEGELVDGVLEEEEVPSVEHELVVMWIGAMLRAWGAARGALVLGSEAKYAVTAKRGRKPDVAMYLPGSPKPARRGLVRAAPDVAVEVVSPTARDARRDRIDKLEDYAAFGVRFYWIVDPDLRAVEMYELGADGSYTRRVSATGGVIERIPGCHGLSLDLAALWSELDALPAD